MLLQGAAADVFPTRVGVDRQRVAPMRRCERFPHARGGGPQVAMEQTAYTTFSPRAWGWTVGITIIQESLEVFPTRVGVDRIF